MKSLYALLLLLLSPGLHADEVFAVQLPECPARLERRTLEPELVMVRSDCPLSLASLVQLLDQGLQGLFPDHQLAIHSISLGRLQNYPAWSQDLATAAAKSPTWNSRRGRPAKSGENHNQRVRLLLNGPAYPPQLKPLFAAYGLSACVAAVEKVLVLKAKDIWPGQKATRNGISAAARLPVDGQIWLGLQSLSTDCATR